MKSFSWGFPVKLMGKANSWHHTRGQPCPTRKNDSMPWTTNSTCPNFHGQALTITRFWTMPAHEPSKFPGNYFPDMNELTPSDNASRSAVLRFQDRLLNNIPDDIDFCLLAGEQFYKPGERWHRFLLFSTQTSFWSLVASESFLSKWMQHA